MEPTNTRVLFKQKVTEYVIADFHFVT